MTRESDIQRSVRLALGTKPRLLLMRNNVGHVRYMTASGAFHEFDYGLGKGSADLIGCLAGCACPHCGQSIPWGRFIAFEVKRPNAKQTPDQVQWEQRLRYNGGMYQVVHSVDEAESAHAMALRGEM